MSEELNNEVVRGQEDGQITYATEVISTIVSVATTEVEGISGIAGGGTISGIIGRGKAPRGVKVDVNGNRVSVDISVSVDYGIPIQKVGRNCQENVRKSIETMTGLTVEKVDLHVVSVSFEKENQEMQESQKLALTLEEEPAEEKPAAAQPVEEEPAEEVHSDETPSEETADEAQSESEGGEPFVAEIIEEEETEEPQPEEDRWDDEPEEDEAPDEDGEES